MKRILKSLLYIFLILVTVVLILSLKVTTRQGINYQWRSIKMPLYLKILDFFDRHFNYKQLVKDIITDSKTDEERVMKIFQWTYKNIKNQPNNLPVIDDHVWHIIIRGYGADDQSCDVFATLCNYAGVDAFFTWVFSKDRRRISLSFVKLNQKWVVFDSYRGVYFKNEKGKFAGTEDITLGNYKLVKSSDGELDIDYKDYFYNLPAIKNVALSRPKIQSPFLRIFFEINKIRNINRNN